MNALLFAALAAAAPVETWGVFEAELRGPRDGNPFAEVELTAELRQRDRTAKVRGFYDGDGVYRFRFSPDREGEWSWVTRSNRPALDGKRGAFRAGPPRPGNHGPVRVHDRFHFAHADGTPYYPFGTTIYALPHQTEALQQRTLASLAKAPFNKLRLCVLPKWYDFNRIEPPLYPFARGADGRFDHARPDPAFWRLLERRLLDLQRLGIEADLILLHPYDAPHWGFASMGHDNDRRFLRYAVARLGAYRNVWWSMANEWDFVKGRTVQQWTDLIEVVAAEDPYRRLHSIHNGAKFFDHRHPALTHASVLSPEVHRLREWREQYGKPVVDDEAEYEGNVEHSWGNITGQELVHRHWMGFLLGAYVGHGETFLSPDDVLWWSRGGVLRGESPPRLAFLRKLVEEGRLDPVPETWPLPKTPAARQGKRFLMYLGRQSPAVLTDGVVRKLARTDPALAEARWRFEVLDTWAMTITPIEGEHQGQFRLPLPGKPYLALRATPVARP